MRLIACSIIKIYICFIFVATKSVHILVANSPKLLSNWEFDIFVTLTLTIINLRLNSGLYFNNIAALEKTNSPSLVIMYASPIDSVCE